jgi:serine/threonine protein kinase
MPGRDAYREAIQNPDNFGLPLLKRLRLVRDPATNAPLAWPGAFGIVFRMENSQGEARAVKCFTSPYPIRAERYEAVSDYFDTLFSRNTPSVRFLAESYYARQGIQVGRRWQPVLVMEWVEGDLFNRHLASLCAGVNPTPQLLALARTWTELVRALRADRLVHGDLQHGNVLVTPDGTIKLIDYDGMCVPLLIGRFVLEGGHPNYQHPRRVQHFNERLDEFSALIILAGLVILAAYPELWVRYDIQRNVLFQESDFKNPEKSPLFAELGTLEHPAIRIVTQAMRRACIARNTDEIPSFDDVADALGL